MLAFAPPATLTDWVGPLRTRLHGFRCLARRDDAAGPAPQGGATPSGGAKTAHSGASN